MTALYFIIFVVTTISMVYYTRRADALSRGIISIESGFDVKLKNWNDTANRIGALFGGILWLMVVVAIVIALFAHFGWWAIFII